MNATPKNPTVSTTAMACPVSAFQTASRSAVGLGSTTHDSAMRWRLRIFPSPFRILQQLTEPRQRGIHPLPTLARHVLERQFPLQHRQLGLDVVQRELSRALGHGHFSEGSSEFEICE